jgi:polyhydroxybutyrate depolymerase
MNALQMFLLQTSRWCAERTLQVEVKFITVVVLSFLFIVQAQTEAGNLTFEGQERTYLIHVPPGYNSQVPVPLLLALHGRGGDGSSMARLTAFNYLADEENFIVVYPDGLDNRWNFVTDPPGYGRMRQDDVGFLLALLDEVSSQYSIDATRVYVTGFSNGGFMTQRLACAAPERFAAFASVGGAGFVGLSELCQTPSSLSLLLMHGTEDSIVPWSGHTRRRLESVEETFAFWSIYTGCDGEVTETALAQQGHSPDTSVTLLTAFCPEGNELLLYEVEGGGHNWPGVPDVLPENVAGRVTMDILASEVIWEFFSRHEK